MTDRLRYRTGPAFYDCFRYGRNKSFSLFLSYNIPGYLHGSPQLRPPVKCGMGVCGNHMHKIMLKEEYAEFPDIFSKFSGYAHCSNLHQNAFTYDRIKRLGMGQEPCISLRMCDYRRKARLEQEQQKCVPVRGNCSGRKLGKKISAIPVDC